MEPPFSPLAFSLVLLVGMVILFAAGRQLGLRRRLDKSAGERESLGTLEGAVFGLFGLLIAFTFSGAASRFSEKRALIADEVGFTRTAYLRLQLVPENERVALEELQERDERALPSVDPYRTQRGELGVVRPAVGGAH